MKLASFVTSTPIRKQSSSSTPPKLLAEFSNNTDSKTLDVSENPEDFESAQFNIEIGCKNNVQDENTFVDIDLNDDNVFDELLLREDVSKTDSQTSVHEFVRNKTRRSIKKLKGLLGSSFNKNSSSNDASTVENTTGKVALKRKVKDDAVKNIVEKLKIALAKLHQKLRQKKNKNTFLMESIPVTYEEDLKSLCKAFVHLENILEEKSEHVKTLENNLSYVENLLAEKHCCLKRKESECSVLKEKIIELQKELEDFKHEIVNVNEPESEVKSVADEDLIPNTHETTITIKESCVSNYLFIGLILIQISSISLMCC